MNFLTKRNGRRALLALALSGFLPTSVLAGEVSLKSADGTVNLVGEFIEFKDDAYVIRTALGDLRISSSRVRCEGADCPVFETNDADVTVVGSEVIGLGLMPLLMTGYAAALNAEAEITNTQTDGEAIAKFIGDDGFGDEIGNYLVKSSTSTDSFTALLANEAQIGMSSRRILPPEARELRDGGAGNMVSPQQEHVIAVDSLVVIVHPSNPVSAMSIEDLRKVYTGEVSNWSELGGADLAIKAINREEASGTQGVFAERVLGDSGEEFAADQEVVDNNNSMAAEVNEDPAAIGYVGYAFQRGAKPLDLVNECGIPTKPDAFSAKTEEYALQRRLYLYNRGDNLNEQTTGLINFATSSESDGVIAKSGFIDLGIRKRAQPLDSDRARLLIETTTDPFEAGVMREMLEVMPEFDRLSTTFRFKQGSSRLDEKGIVDMDRLISYLEREPDGTTISVVGFTDDVGAFEANDALSEDRARQVAFDLNERAQGRLDNIKVEVSGYGELAPAACNTSNAGQAINRRVEIWLANGTRDD